MSAYVAALQDPYVLEFLYGHTGPIIRGETDPTDGVTPVELLVHGADVSGDLNPVGAGLVLRSGGEDPAGAVSAVVSSGDVEIYCGTLKGAGAYGNMYVGRDAGATAARYPNGLYLNSFTATRVQWRGSTKIFTEGTQFNLSIPEINWNYNVAAPIVWQLTDATPGVTGDDLTIAAQSVSDPAGAAVSGNLGLRGGQGLVHAGNLDGNVWFHVAAANYQSMAKGIFIADCVTAPTGNPANGGFLYSNTGAGTWRGSGGTITAFGPADQHCEKCGYDFWTNHYENPEWGAYLKQCGMCGEIYKSGPKSVLGKLTGKQKALMVRHKPNEWS